MKRIILHIDMDAFFAAVEQRDNPSLRGKPVVIGADPKQGKGRGVVSTCSYEAREFGIHSAMPISQAYLRCPGAVYLPGRYKAYKEASQHVMKILYDFSPCIEQISIDEAFLDISGCIRLLGSPEKIAQNIKQRIKNEVGLTASVGIAPSKFVAKIASDLEKPDGLVIVEANNVKNFLRPLPISRMWGVGKKTEPFLLKIGVKTIGDLADYSQKEICDLLGKHGLHFWKLANGIDQRDVIEYEGAKSVSQERTFEKDTNDIPYIKNTLFYLGNEVSRLLRKQRLKGKTVTLKIRLDDFSTFTRSKSGNDFMNSSLWIQKIITELFNQFDLQHKKVRLLGVGVSNLNAVHGEQISLFEQNDREAGKADFVIDLIEEKFGRDAIRKASIMNRKSNYLTEPKFKPRGEE